MTAWNLTGKLSASRILPGRLTALRLEGELDLPSVRPLVELLAGFEADGVVVDCSGLRTVSDVALGSLATEVDGLPRPVVRLAGLPDHSLRILRALRLDRVTRIRAGSPER